MAGKLDYRWHLRQVMAARGMFATTDLAPLLAERGIHLSSSQVYRLVVERPERLSLKVLMALLDILDCTMADLIEPIAAAQPAAKREPAAGRRPGSAACAPSAHGSAGPAADRWLPRRLTCLPTRSASSPAWSPGSNRRWTGRRSRTR